MGGNRRMSRRATEARRRTRAVKGQPSTDEASVRPRRTSSRRLAAVACAVAVIAVLVAGAAIARVDVVSRQASAALAGRASAIDHTVEKQRISSTARLDQLTGVTIDAKQVFAEADPSIVTIYCDVGQGTGFAVDVAPPAGYQTTIVTAAHVIRGCGQIRVYERGHADWTEAKVLKVDRRNDLASLAIKIGLPALKSGGVVDPATPVVTVGSPYGYPDTVTQGVVATVYDDVIITDNALNPGNSGGPLLNSEAHVLGVARSDLVGGGSSLAEFIPMTVTCKTLFKECPFGIADSVP